MATIYPMISTISFQDVCYSGRLDHLCFEVEQGSQTLLVTSRADDNTALYQMMAGLVQPLSGMISMFGQHLSEMDAAGLQYMRQTVAIVPAGGGLISNLKLWENITLPIVYEKGTLSGECTEEAYDYLRKLNYSGNIMALPAHLSLNEKRMAAFIRGALKRASLMIYSDCFDMSSDTNRSNFISVIKEYHQADTTRTALFISTSEKIAADISPDRVIQLHRSASNTLGS